MTEDQPLQHQLHDLAHRVMDEVDLANEHLEHAYEALLEFADHVVAAEPGWASILLQEAGRLQAAADVGVTTAEEVHDPATWNLPAFGDEADMARA